MNKLSILLLVGLTAACSEQAEDTLTSAADRATSVTVAQATPRDIDYVLKALGSVESIHHPTLSAETSGQIVSVNISEGQSVEVRQQLATIDNTLHEIEAAKAQADLKRQSVVLENQRRVVDRLKRLEKSQSVSKDQLEDEQAQLEMMEAQRDIAQKQWEQAQYMVSKTKVLAPQAGLIARRHISLGDYVTVGKPLFDLVSVSRLKARLSFPEHDADKIAVGKEVRLTSPAAPDVLAIGEVTGINPQISIHNRSIEVTVEFDNPGGWLPGASVDATMVIDTHAGALTVPATSVVSRSDTTVVFVVEGDKARMVEVTLGWSEVDWVEITNGIAATDRLVVQGAGLITDGSALLERP